MDQNNKFEYTYSAADQTELELIRKKYLPRVETKQERIRRLDRSVTNRACAIAIMIGLIGTLTMGFGMCLCMEWRYYVAGICIGILGIGMILLAYPAYQKFLNIQRAKIAPKILQLYDDLTTETQKSEID